MSDSLVGQASSATLLRPLRLGSRQMPNRIVFGAHLTNFGRGNVFTDRHLAYYRARAAGGAGMIVTENLTVHPQDWPYEHVPHGHTDAAVPSLQRLAEAVRTVGNGTLLLAQLNHWGGQSNGKQLRQSPWAPSAVPEVASKRMARAMLADEIEQVIEGFAAAAARAALADLDGVEVHAGQHSLIRQFLSPLSNFRDDDYGGTLDNRTRFLLRVLVAVRKSLGADRVLGLKLCGDELAPWGGLTPQDAVQIAQRVAATGSVNYLSMQIGGPYSVHVTEAAMPTEQGHAAYLAHAVREGLAGVLPVFAEGRIEEPAVAAGLLEDGTADAAVMTRALVSDPELPRKVAGSNQEPVRPHIGMTRYFSVLADWNRPLGDLINPRAGREASLLPPAAVEDPQPVLVIGAGPAGLEAATTLARQGHAVTVWDRAAEIGGWAAILAREVPARAEFGKLVAYYAALLDRLGVDVRLGRNVEPDADVSGYARVLLAMGAVSPPPWFECSGGPVFSPRTLIGGLRNEALPRPETGRAVVVDRELGFRMANAVEWLLAHGYGVDVVTEDFSVGRELVESSEFLWFNRAAAQGVGLYPRLRAERYAEQTLVCRDRFSGAERTFGPVSILVAAQPEMPEPDLTAALRGNHPWVTPVGDARAPRLMGEAILDAHRGVLLA